MTAPKIKYYAWDTETHDPHLTDKGPSWIFNEGHVICTGLFDLQTRKKKALPGNGETILRPLFSDPTVILIGANIGYDLGWAMYEMGLILSDIKCSFIDVIAAETLLDQSIFASLDTLSWKYLKERKQSEALVGIAVGLGLKGDFRKHLLALWQQGYQDQILDYVLSDTDQPARIWEKQRELIVDLDMDRANEINMAMIKATTEMRRHGVRIDYDKWLANCKIIGDAYEILNKDFVAKYGEVNVNSPKQLAELFRAYDVPFRYKIVFKGWKPDGRKFAKTDWFEGDTIWDQRSRLKGSFPNVRVVKKKICLFVPEQYAARTRLQAEKMGYEVSCNPSINKFTFGATKGTYQVSADVVELKQAKNITDKFLGPKFARFLAKDQHGDWRLHGAINPVGAKQTGRMSSNAPNLQNIPSKTVLFDKTDKAINLAQLCREVFLPERGHILVKLDFNGQENRLQAHFAHGNEGILIRQMYNDNPRLDEHQFVADRSGLQEQYGKKNGRKYAKNVRFGLCYGMQVTTMCEQFTWEKDFATELIDLVKEASPWFSVTMARIQDMLTGRGDFARPNDRGQLPPGKKAMRRYIKTLLNRHIYLREGYDRDAYKFYNYLIQGSAADMMKEAIWNIMKTKTCEELLLLVHDEAVFSVPMTAEGYKRIEELQYWMEHSSQLTVPILCDPEVGPNWWDTEGQTCQKDAEGEDIAGAFIESVKQLVTRAAKKIKATKPAKTVKVRQDEQELAYVTDELIVDSAIDEDDDEGDE